MWTEKTITVNGIKIWYSCKHFDEASVYGINRGKISKLSLKQNGRLVYQYNRELVLAPQTEEAKKALDYLMNKYN